jgi:hypothetical protein
MFKRYKYDVAISVAEEDKLVAKLITKQLDKLRIRYYYYEEKAAESWGEYIINLTADSYGRSARYVLLITSKYYVKKYWSNIEKQLALATPRPDNIHILQLRLDDTPVDGISKYVSYQEWKNNPEEIARLIRQKIKEQKQVSRREKSMYAYVVLALLAMVFTTYFIVRHPRRSRDTGNPADFQKVLITKSLSDSFYISNTEVTIAQYQDYCNSQLKPMPIQPPLYDNKGPVVNITWDEAQQFCKWKGGRLPTTAEWIYAASCGSQTKYSGGNNAQQVAVYNRVKPVKTGTKVHNAFGLYDMSGNVAEWCADWSDSSYQYKIIKGGAYNSHIAELTISSSYKEKPTVRQPYIGFRIAWDK